MSNQVLKISESLMNFVNSNKSSFTAVQIHAFVDSIQNMRGLYNQNVTEYQTEVNSSLKDLTTNLEFIEKFTKELKGEFLKVNKLCRDVNESLSSLHLKVDKLCVEEDAAPQESLSELDSSSAEVPAVVEVPAVAKVPAVAEAAAEDPPSDKVGEPPKKDGILKIKYRPEPAAVFETTKVEIKPNSPNVTLGVQDK